MLMRSNKAYCKQAWSSAYNTYEAKGKTLPQQQAGKLPAGTSKVGDNNVSNQMWGQADSTCKALMAEMEQQSRRSTRAFSSSAST